jgi:hypothetical protein
MESWLCNLTELNSDGVVEFAAEDGDSKKTRAGVRACWGGVEHETKAPRRGLKQQEHELKLG